MGNSECCTTGFKQKIVSTLLFGKQILLNPATTFCNMEREGGFTQPLLFLATMGFIAGVVKLFVTFYFMANGVAIGLCSALSALIIMPIIVVAIGYIGAFLLSIVMRLVGCDDNLELAVRVVSYLAVISPIAVLISPIPYIGTLLVLGILTYLLVAAGIEVYQLKSNNAWLLFGLGLGLLALLSLGSAIATRHRSQVTIPVIVCPAALVDSATGHH